MVKLVCMAVVCGGLAVAQKQLSIELTRPEPAHYSKTVRRFAAQATASGASAAANPVSAPISGYVLDPASGVRPILGFGPFSSIGAPLDFAENFAAMIPSPNQNYLVEVDSTGLATLWVDDNGELGQTPFPSDVSATSFVAPSPLGFSVAVVSGSRALVQVFSSLPNAPALAASWSFSDLGGAPGSLAVSDDGSTLLYTIRQGRREALRALHQGGAPQFMGAGEFGNLAFAPFSLDAAASEPAADRVYLYRDSNGQYGSVLLGTKAAGVSRPVGLQFSRDGQQVVVASAGSGSIQMLRADGGGSSTTSCQCAPAALTRLLGNTIFQITAFDGSGISIFDGDLPAPAVVPSSLQTNSGSN